MKFLRTQIVTAALLSLCTLAKADLDGDVYSDFTTFQSKNRVEMIVDVDALVGSDLVLFPNTTYQAGDVVFSEPENLRLFNKSIFDTATALVTADSYNTTLTITFENGFDVVGFWYGAISDDRTITITAYDAVSGGSSVYISDYIMAPDLNADPLAFFGLSTSERSTVSSSPAERLSRWGTCSRDPRFPSPRPTPSCSAPWCLAS
jgi:hypothetical protein